MLDELWQVLLDRKARPKDGSYTKELLDGGQERILRKIHEETLELTLAATSEGQGRLVEESADLLYHLLVLLLASGVELEQVWAELRDRRSVSNDGGEAEEKS